MELFKKIVLMTIILLSIPFVYAQNCNDPDGLNFFEKNCVTFYSMDYCDRCVNSKILIEGRCNEDNLILTPHDCSPDLCKDGKCTQIASTTSSTTSTTTTIPVINQVLTVISLVDGYWDYLSNIPIEVDSNRKMTEEGMVNYSLSLGTHSINAFNYNSREFSHFWDPDCDGNGNFRDASNSYNFMIYGKDRTIIALYKVFTKIVDLKYDGTNIKGQLLDEGDNPIIESGCSHNSCSNADECEIIIYPNRNVNLYYYDGSWKGINSVDSNINDGSFSYNWICPVGTIKIKAEYIPTGNNWYYSSNMIEIPVSCAAPTSTTSSTSTTSTTYTSSTSTTTTRLSSSSTSTTSTTYTSSTSTTTTRLSSSSTSTTSTVPPYESAGIKSLSCTKAESPINSCSEALDIYYIDDITAPDSVDCGENIEIQVAWTGFHGVPDRCEKNYWAFFLETSQDSYSFLDSCESFDNSDCQLPDDQPNTYVMKYNVKMPDNGTIADGTYNIYVTGETYGGYCYPNENNVDANANVIINLKNCGSGESFTTTTSTTTTITPGDVTTSTTSTTIPSGEPSGGDVTTSTTSTTISEGGGCPILKAFDGKEFVKIEKLNIHSSGDQDTITTSTFTMEPINGKYELILDEAAYLFWDGSHIDSVKLTDETGKKCNLISATHSKDGDILAAITNSDDVRVRSYPGDRIKLVYDGCSGNQFTFSIEGYNKKMMVEPLSTTNKITLVVILALIISAIIFGILKFTNNKNTEPIPQYDEEKSEEGSAESFY